MSPRLAIRLDEKAARKEAPDQSDIRNPPLVRIVLYMAITALLLPDAVEDRRGAPRYRVRLDLTPVNLCHQTIRVNIHEISATGLLFYSEQALQSGSILFLELPNTQCKVAKIAWASQHLHGVEFDKPLTSEELQRLRTTSTVVWPRFQDRHPGPNPGPCPDPKDTPPLDHDDTEHEGKLPLSQRLGIIFGATSVLWAVIFGGVWLAVQ